MDDNYHVVNSATANRQLRTAPVPGIAFGSSILLTRSVLFECGNNDFYRIRPFIITIPLIR